MRTVNSLVALSRTLVRTPSLVRLPTRVSAFLVRYFRQFPVVRAGGRLILHSHLPPIDSPVYARFVRLHLLDRIDAPSHGQVAVTNACPQRCPVCYNRDREGTPLTPHETRRVIEALIDAGLVWLGITGGEPLLCRGLPDLIALGGNRAAVKLFTTGMGLTSALATELRDAGLFSVSVSIDDVDEARHDEGRGLTGAWRAAVKAVETFLAAGGLHVGISAVLSREMIRRPERIDRLMAFAASLGVHEVWLSEAKPAVASLWDPALVLTEDERRAVAAYQDSWNARVARTEGAVPLNYLGHFEGAERFGCNAGRKMIYVDPFGDVSPCVFTPFSLGNVRDRLIGEIIEDMVARFPGEDRCFMNRNWPIVAAASGGTLPVRRDETIAMLDRIEFRGVSEFNRRLYGPRGRD